ncbi:MAG: translocation/assembly module TamB domain-containing protein, partial [Bacteroidota bacterium]
MQKKYTIRFKSILKRTLKIVLWTIVSIIALFLLVAIALQIPAVQNFAKNKAIDYLEGKIHTKVTLNRIEIGLPKKVILEGFYFEDQHKDTLLAGEKLAVDISLFELFNNKVELNSVDLQQITAHISRNKKGVYNFDYIIKAFASEEKKKDDSKPTEFSIDKINLDKVKFTYKDAYSNNDIALYVNHFDTRIKTFDVNQMVFEIPKAKIDGLNLKLKQGIVETVEEIKDVVVEKTKDNVLKLKLGDIDLSRIVVDFQDEKSKLITKINLQKLAVTFETIDLKKGLLAIKNLDVSDTKGSLELGKLERSMMKNDPTTLVANWKVKVDNINLKNVDFKFDDNNEVAVQNGIDYNHFDLKKIQLNAEKLDYSSQNTSGIINSFAVNDKSGLEVQQLRTNFNYNNKGVILKNLYVKTPQTVLKNQITIGYPSVELLQKNPGELSITANIVNSKLGFKDLLLFVPSLKNTIPFKNNHNAILNINSVSSGKLKNIHIPKLEISGIGNTKIVASGRIIGLPHINKTYFDLNIKNAQSTAKDINQFVPKGTIPNSIQLPTQFATKGTFKGTINNFFTNLNVSSTFGNAKIKARFDQRKKNQERYDAQTELDNFDLGKFIKNDSIGKITLKANVKGVGLNPKTANAVVDGTVLKFDFNKYTYTDLKLNGKINKGLFDVKAATNDPNLTFQLLANGSFRDKYPSGKLKLNIDIADLNKLNLHAGPLKLKGEIDADIQSANIDYLNGKILATNFVIANEKDQYVLDTITVTASTTAQKNTLQIKSQFLDATADGKYKLSQLSDAIQNSIAKYYDANANYVKGRNTASNSQQFAFKVNVKDNKILLNLVPKLKSLDPIHIDGRYNSVNDSIVVNGSIPKLNYDAIDISGATLNINTQDNALVYSLNVNSIQQGSFQLAASTLSGKVVNNTIDYTLQLKDVKNKERYLVAGTLKATNGNTEINLNPANLILNYEAWNLSQENLIRFGQNGIYANDFELSKAGNSIKIQSLNTQPNAPIAIDFKDFELATITNIAQKSDWQMSGKINGNAVIKNLQTNPIFTSDLIVDTFTFQKDTVGMLKIKVNNETANRYDAKIELTGLGNQLFLDGNYNTASSSFDMNLAIEKLQVKSLQGFTFGNIKESTGFLNGNLKITGKATQPNVVGELKFNEVGFIATKLNSQLKSMNDKVVFSDNSITLNNFVIRDEKDNDLTINGKINSQDYTNLGFNLTLDADNFKAINSKERDNQDFYGELYLDNHLRIKGDYNNPIVDGNIKINKDTKFTIVLPQDDPSIADREGIVEFIDQDQPKLFTTVAVDENLSEMLIKGINASVNIEIDKEAELSLIIDKANGDFLKLKGEAQLTGGIDPSGKTTLTGRYELNQGSYEMSFNLIKRKFDIKKGSYILWTGEPTTADINITAVYKVETAPINLLNEQLS